MYSLYDYDTRHSFKANLLDKLSKLSNLKEEEFNHIVSNLQDNPVLLQAYQNFMLKAKLTYSEEFTRINLSRLKDQQRRDEDYKKRLAVINAKKDRAKQLLEMKKRIQQFDLKTQEEIKELQIGEFLNVNFFGKLSLGDRFRRPW